MMMIMIVMDGSLPYLPHLFGRIGFVLNVCEVVQKCI